MFHAHVVPTEQRSAHSCDAWPSKAHTAYGSREALWREHLFETFLAWINNTLATTSALALYRLDSATWVKLLREGDVSGERPPDVVIPLRTNPEQP